MLKKGKGVILNVASTNGYLVKEEYVAVCTAMAGLVTLTQALGVEWAARGVRVVGLAPGRISPDCNVDKSTVTAADLEFYKGRTPMRRMGTYNEIAEAALFLASDDASYILAETLTVDGGWISYQLF
jgi:NAD(P)-dependent dehydrogenase (short-subunit alcohol dehydrogenase family)